MSLNILNTQALFGTPSNPPNNIHLMQYILSQHFLPHVAALYYRHFMSQHSARVRRDLMAMRAVQRGLAPRAPAPQPRPQPQPRRPGRLHRGNTCNGRPLGRERRLRRQGRQMGSDLDWYGNSEPRQLILKANASVLGDILRVCNPAQLLAMYDLAVEMTKANEDVPDHIAGVFNALMGKDADTPLVVRTFEIAIR